MPKNLWGELPADAELRTPTQLLKEQASALSDATRGALEGVVSVAHQQEKFVITLSILAPALENYSYEVLYVEHPLQMYPLKVVPSYARYMVSEHIACANEAELEAAVQQVLQSRRVRQVVTTLLAHSR
jgi:hypothetical protein